MMERGDVIVSARCVYRILDAVPVDSAKWGNRTRVVAVKIGTATDHEADVPPDLEPGAEIYWTQTYRRGEGPEEFFGAMSCQT